MQTIKTFRQQTNDTNPPFELVSIPHDLAHFA